MELNKEFLEMIEDRIPGGRFLTTAALLLGLLAVIALSCDELWKHIVLPIYTTIAAAITRGIVTRGEFFRFLLSIAFSGGFFWLLEWAVKGSRHLMRDVLINSKSILESHDKVLAAAEETYQKMLEVAEALHQLEGRVEALESGKSLILPQGGEN